MWMLAVRRGAWALFVFGVAVVGGFFHLAVGVLIAAVGLGLWLLTWAWQHWRGEQIRPAIEINEGLISGDLLTLMSTEETRATLAISSPKTTLKKCSVRLIWVETWDTRDAVTHRVQPTYLQWGAREAGAYGPGREYLDIAATSGEHILDVAITTLPEGFKIARAGDEAKAEKLPDWSFHLVSATEQHQFHEGWYQAMLRITAEENDPPSSKDVHVALGLKKNGLYADLRLKDWDTTVDELPSLPAGLSPMRAKRS